jgi:glyoxylase-like metal-dependent hydrolase (beta-lactamase superfamily II)
VTDYPYPDPDVDPAAATDVARDVVVLANRDVPLVPNIGLVGGTEAVLVVDTGLGPGNADRVVRFALEYARGRRLFLTTTHFHPEHAFGAQSFAGLATWIVNRGQAADLAAKAPGYLEMFRTLGEPVARRLEGVALVEPDVVHDGEHELDLGGRTVSLRQTGRAHTRGDQVVVVPDAGVLFAGDLVEAGQFSIFPWFPPHDTDVSGLAWIEVMERLIASEPRIVVPGHGTTGGPEVLEGVRDYLCELRDETWRRRDSAMKEADVVAEVRAVLVERHPEWAGQEWIERGVGCLCAEPRDSALRGFSVD